MAKFIEMRGKLGIGHYAIVDDEDYKYLAQFRWYIDPHGYAMRNEQGHSTTVKMHREVLGLADPRIEVDHINHDPLDNRRDNLRPASHAENNRNRYRQSNSTSGYKGVSRFRSKWQAGIKVDGKRIHLGHFLSPEEAARAYDDAALHYFGRFAYLNFGHGE